MQSVRPTLICILFASSLCKIQFLKQTLGPIVFAFQTPH